MLKRPQAQKKIKLDNDILDENEQIDVDKSIKPDDIGDEHTEEAIPIEEGIENSIKEDNPLNVVAESVDMKTEPAEIVDDQYLLEKQNPTEEDVKSSENINIKEDNDKSIENSVVVEQENEKSKTSFIEENPDPSQTGTDNVDQPINCKEDTGVAVDVENTLEN